MTYCNQHNLEQDFSGCYICSECGRIWMPVQPEKYDEYVRQTMNYDESTAKTDDEAIKLQDQ